MSPGRTSPNIREVPSNIEGRTVSYFEWNLMI
jgi:hypothetical protein